MPYRLVLIFAFLFWAVVSEGAGEDVRVRSLTKEETLSGMRLVLDLSGEPRYRVKTSGQRVDLFLEGARADRDLGRLLENGNLVKVLVGQREKETLISFLLRTPPQNVNVLTEKEPVSLILDLAWGRRLAGERPAMAFQSGGAAVISSDGVSIRRLKRSEYAGNWNRFFADFEAPLAVDAPLVFTLLDLPQVIFSPVEDGLDGRTLKYGVELGQKGDWSEALKVFRGLDGDRLQGVDREAALIFYGEALVRTGNFAEAREVLDEFLSNCPDSALLERGRFLSAYAQASGGSPYSTLVELSRLDRTLPEGGTYATLCDLLEGEVELVTGRLGRALECLRCPEPGDRGKAAEVLLLRQADALAGLGRFKEALPIFQRLADKDIFRPGNPFSLAGYAETLYRSDRPLESAAQFARLSLQLAGTSAEGLARFGEVRGLLKGGREKPARLLLEQIVVQYPGSEAASRARLKLADLAVVSGEEQARQWAVTEYRKIADAAPTRGLINEASVKEAILLHQTGNSRKSVESLESFLRRNISGPLQAEGEALLGEILPGVIEELLVQGEEMDALVLVERHRERLVSGAVTTRLLLDLGDAFERFGLLERAGKIFFFLRDAYLGTPEEEMIYLPLVRTLFQDGKFTQAAEYAGQALERFPKGANRRELLALRVEALLEDGRTEEAAKELTASDSPFTESADVVAGKAFWEMGKYELVEQFMGRALADGEGGEADPCVLAMQAESLYLQGKAAQALPLYQRLAEMEGFTDQAIYRWAQILQEQGKDQEAFKLFRRLSEEGTSPRWKKVGSEFLNLAKMDRRR